MSNYGNTNKGILFINDTKGNDKAPTLKGKINVNGKEYELAGWTKQGKNGEFYSLSISEPFKKQTSTLTDEPKNNLPF